MTIYDKIRDEQLLYYINIKGAKTSVLSSDKIDKYEAFTGQEILRSNQGQMIEHAKFTSSFSRKALGNKKQTG